MIELKAIKKTQGKDDVMEVTIEIGGMPSDIEEELEAILYNLYKRTHEKTGLEFLHRMCRATRNAMGRIIAEVFDDGKL